jgi:hypothetical protein
LVTRVSRFPLDNNTEKAKQAYDFFTRMEEKKECFTLKDILEQTDYTEGTAQGYLNKKWRRWFLCENADGSYYCKGLKGKYSESYFIREHSQLWYPPDPWIGKNELLVWVFLLMFLVAYYERSRRWRVKIWGIHLPLSQLF